MRKFRIYFYKLLIYHVLCVLWHNDDWENSSYILDMDDIHVFWHGILRNDMIRFDLLYNVFHLKNILKIKNLLYWID